MSPEFPPETQQIPEVIKKPHRFVVVMPYSSNLKDTEPRRGEPRLSFYSAFALNAAYELYRRGLAENFILCGEETFGSGKPTGTDLMKESLLRLRVLPIDILTIRGKNLNNTAYQIQAVSEFQEELGPEARKFLVVDWSFHDERIRNHIRGFGLDAETVTAEEVHKYLRPEFNLEKLQGILPYEFEQRERKLRALSRFDKRGIFPRLGTRFRGGSVTDIEKTRDGQGKLILRLLDTTGKKRLQDFF